MNQKFFLEIQRLQSKQEQIAYQRKHRKRIVRRCDCCHQIPRNCDVAGGIEPKAVLWRQGNKDNKPCPNCPFCILFPALHILYKLSSHASMLQLKAPPDHFAAGSEARRNAELELERATTFIPEEVLSQLPGQSYVRQDGIMVCIILSTCNFMRKRI